MITIKPSDDIVNFEFSFQFQGKWITCEEIILKLKTLTAQERAKLKEMLESKKRDVRKDINMWMIEHPYDSPEYLCALIDMHTKFNGALDLITNYEEIIK